MYCEFCGKFVEGKSYGGHKTNCKNRSSEYKDALFEHRSKAALGRKMPQTTKDKISASRIAYLQKHPDKVPYVLNHRYKETYPEKYFKEMLPNFISQYNIPETLYCADFANPAEKYIIEIDGEQHYVDEKIVKHDIVRTKILENLGWHITRIRWSSYSKLTRSEKEEIIGLLNMHSHFEMKLYEKHKNKCIDCGEEINKRSIRCIKCSNIFKNKRKFEVSKEELEVLIKEKPMTEIGKQFGVSGGAVKKRCKKLGIELKDMRGYWSKLRAGKI